MSTIHLVSHTHWDREWYFTFQQFRLKLTHLIDHLLEILETQPDFRSFLLDGQTILLEDYLQFRPEKEAELRQLISAGRILIGPWYVSPDEFLVAPEAHIRNLLQGGKLCRKYGGRMAVGYLPDTFGHIGQMPQILRGFGIDTACLWRGVGDAPAELIWRAPDGSEVLLGYLHESYGNAASLTPSNPEKFAEDIKELTRSLEAYVTTGQVLLMNGMDHMEPSVQLAQAVRTYQSAQHADTLIFSSLPEYFNQVRRFLETSGQALPEVKGELRSPKHAYLLPNVLSTRIWLKQQNHTCETDLLRWVEPLNAWVQLLEQAAASARPNLNDRLNQYISNPQPVIHYAWKMLMQCHPHDSICGTSIDQVVREMEIRFDQVDQINQELINQSLHRISDQVDTTYPMNTSGKNEPQDILSALLVFNPNDEVSSGPVTIKYKLPYGYSSLEVVDEKGAVVPHHQSGMDQRELINMVMDKKELKQGLAMVNEGTVADMVIKHFDILKRDKQAIIETMISDHGQVSWEEWKHSISRVEEIIADPIIEEYHIHAYSDPEVSLSFVAKDVPGHGYRNYWISAKARPGVQTSTPIKLNPVVKALLPLGNFVTRLPILSIFIHRRKKKHSRPPYRIENEYLVVEAHASDGTLSITDKRNDQVYTGLNLLTDGGDCGDLYNFCPPANDQIIKAQVVKIEDESDEVHQCLRIRYQMNLPRSLSDDRKSRSWHKVDIFLESEVTLISGVPRVDVTTTLDNRASDHRLRVHFPAPFTTTSAWHDGHFEIVERFIGLPAYDETWPEPPRPEVPQREFTSIASNHLSLTIANRGLPEVEVLLNETGRAEIALTLLRCVGWLSRDDFTTRKGHAGPMGIETPLAQMQGYSTFAYSIIPGNEDWRQSIPHARAFNGALRVTETDIHQGALMPTCAMVDNLNKKYFITSIKAAEDGTGLIVRGVNTLSTPIDVALKLWRPFKRASLVRLDEEIIENIAISTQGEVNFRLGGHKIASLLFSD